MRRVAAAALLLLALAVTACAPPGATLARIQRDGVLRVGLDPSFPPFETIENDAVVGLDVDLARALADALGVRVQFDVIGYDGLYDALATGRVDLLASALVPDPARTRDFAYSEPYFNAGQLLVAPVGSDLTDLRGLNGRTLAVELGAQGHVVAIDWARRLPDLTIVPYSAPDAALAAVADGSADATIIDSVSARLYMAANPAALVIVDPAVTVEPYALVVRADDRDLLSALDAALADLAADGRLNAMLDRWLAAP